MLTLSEHSLYLPVVTGRLSLPQGQVFVPNVLQQGTVIFLNPVRPLGFEIE